MHIFIFYLEINQMASQQHCLHVRGTLFLCVATVEEVRGRVPSLEGTVVIIFN